MIGDVFAGLADDRVFNYDHGVKEAPAPLRQKTRWERVSL